MFLILLMGNRRLRRELRIPPEEYADRARQAIAITELLGKINPEDVIHRFENTSQNILMQDPDVTTATFFLPRFKEDYFSIQPDPYHI